MIRRCSDPNAHNYQYYGGRDICVCEEWKSLECFEQWALENGYAPTLQIDRIDNDKGYNPSNCRWVTAKEQHANRRCSFKVDGERISLKELSLLHGIGVETLRARFKRGLSREQATAPINPNYRAFNSPFVKNI